MPEEPPLNTNISIEDEEGGFASLADDERAEDEKEGDTDDDEDNDQIDGDPKPPKPQLMERERGGGSAKGDESLGRSTSTRVKVTTVAGPSSSSAEMMGGTRNQDAIDRARAAHDSRVVTASRQTKPNPTAVSIEGVKVDKL